jgi:hypothetical protein
LPRAFGPGLWPGLAVRPAGSVEAAGSRVGACPSPWRRDRRERPACSTVYKRDARQLVRAGLAGGKGIPDSIAAHPCVFATLTAPSFGPVHSRRMRGNTALPCRPRRDATDQAAAAVAFPIEHEGQVVTLTFGPQTDTRPVRRDTIVATGKPLDVDAVANYIAKYATKTLTAPGVPDIRSQHASEITGLRPAAALVFTSPDGQPLRHSNFHRRAWMPALTATGLAGTHFHVLRHTGNRFTSDAGANTRELMVRMGHDTARAALIYLHSSAERQTCPGKRDRS